MANHGNMTFDQLKDYYKNLWNPGPPPSLTNQSASNALGPGILQNINQPWQIDPSWKSGDSITIGNPGGIFSHIPVPDKTEEVYISERVEDVYYRMVAELYGNDVRLSCTIWIDETQKEGKTWNVLSGKIQETITEAHGWAQEQVEKKSNTMKLFKTLTEKAKKKVQADLANCVRKYT